MVLFIAYPSVSTKMFRLFRCEEVDGHYYLSVDIRLQCYTREWYVGAPPTRTRATRDTWSTPLQSLFWIGWWWRGRCRLLHVTVNSMVDV